MRIFRNAFVVSLICMAAWHFELERERGAAGSHRSVASWLHQAGVQLPRVQASSEGDAIYFSPAVNLEQVDISLIDQAQHSIRIAMYAFTD